MDPVAQFFRSTTAWGMICSFIGGVAVFLPWDVPAFFAPRIGSTLWFGGAISSSFLFLLLYLFATGPLEPIPIWRPIVTFAGAAIILVLFNVYAYGPGGNWVKFVGCWATLLATMGLLIASAAELRSVLKRRNQP